MTRTTTAALTCLLAAAIALGMLTGCNKVTPPAPPSSSPVQSIGSEGVTDTAPDTSSHMAPSTPPQTAGVTEMSAADKHARLSASFNAEWPVADGLVLSAKPQGKGMVFVIDIAEPATQVVPWYQTAMHNRAFTLKASKQTDAANTELTFFRAGVYYVVRVRSIPDGTAEITSAVQSGSPLTLPK